jgi:hypothetical protein
VEAGQLQGGSGVAGLYGRSGAAVALLPHETKQLGPNHDPAASASEFGRINATLRHLTNRHGAAHIEPE